MFIEERHRLILDRIKQDGSISVHEIQEGFNISLDSARRDLRILEQKKLVKRTHGGAISIQGVEVHQDRKRKIKTSIENVEAYESYTEIAKKAASFVESDDVIYLTNSSLGFLMLKELPRNIEYTIVVNSATLADELKYWDNVTIYVVGGKMRMNSTTSIVDGLATAFIQNMHFDLVFLTGMAISAEFGLSVGTDETAIFQRTLVKNSKKSILLAPSQKLGQYSFIKVCELSDFEALITDANEENNEVKKIQEQGLSVITIEKKQ